MSAALAIVALVSSSTCSSAVTLVDDRLAAVLETSPLVSRALNRSDDVVVRFVENATTAVEAAERFEAGTLTCGATVAVAAERIRSPVDGRPLFDAIELPTLAPEPGFADPGPERRARIGRSHDTATWKTPPYLPVRLDEPVVVAVPGGAALAVRMTSTAYGSVGFAYGPVLRLGARGVEDLPPVPTAFDDVPFWMSEDAAVREALDDRAGTLEPGDRVAAVRPGYGGFEKFVAMPDVKLHDPDDDFGRIAFAYSTAFFVPWVSSGLSLLTNPKCVAWCVDLPRGDRAYLARFQQRSLASIDRSRSKLTAFEFATLGVAMLTTLVPSNRRGVLSRVEILEDALIIGEAISVSWTTPLFLQARVGRKRPVAFRDDMNLGDEGRDAIAPALVSIRSNRAAVMLGASMMLLIVEDAGWGWVLAATSVLAGLVAAVSYYEVQSGLAFPTDIPLGIFDGFVNGMGVVAYHQIFWKGWPSDERGGLPLRIQGFHVNLTQGGGIGTLGVAF